MFFRWFWTGKEVKWWNLLISPNWNGELGDKTAYEALVLKKMACSDKKKILLVLNEY